MSQEIKNRRPIRSRDSKWANWLAKQFKDNGIAPNTISVLSFICAEIAGIAFLFSFYHDNTWISELCFVVAIMGIQTRLVCNLLDGMVAIEGGLKSPLGPLYNELPDRLSDIIILLGLGYGLWMFEWSAYLGWVAALCSVMTAYVRLLGGVCGLEQQFLGPMAKQQRMALLTAGCIISIFMPFYGHWILYLCLWMIAIGSLLTTIWRTYHIVIMLNHQNKDNDVEFDNLQNGDNDEEIIREDFPRISIDKL